MNKLFELLADLEKKKLGGGHFVYLGQKQTKTGRTMQISKSFNYKNQRSNLQIDFEGVNYEVNHLMLLVNSHTTLLGKMFNKV